MARSGPPNRPNATDELARYLVKKERTPAKMTGTTTAGGNSIETENRLLPVPIGDPGDVLTVVTNGDGDDVPSWEPATGGYTNEQAQDAVGGILTDSSSIDFTYDDAPNTITAIVILEWLQDAVAAMLTGGSHTNLTATYQDASGTVDLAASGGSSYTDENARDAIGTALVAGNNIDITVNDGADTITIDVEALTSADVGDFTEAAQDAVGAMIADTSSINLTYTDATPELKADAIFGTGSGTVAEGNHGHTTTVGFSVNLGDGTNVIASAEPFVIVRMPYALTVTRWDLQADASGSITLEVERAAEGTPTTFSSVAGSEKPALSSAQTANDTSPFSGGDTTWDAGDRIKVYVSGTPATVKRVALHVTGTRTL